MFYYLEGKISVVESDFAVIDIGGVGYKCYISANTKNSLQINTKYKIFTYCNIKEDAFDIYGFSTISEKNCFEMLISVSGVGPKAAMSILSVTTPQNLAMSIAGEDIRQICAANGVGKKLAQRIILELKEKVSKQFYDSEMPILGEKATSSENQSAEAAKALAVLGFSPTEINSVLRNHNIKGLSVEEIIKFALKENLK